MGIIINMPRKSVETQTMKNSNLKNGARILLFTGVRYERYEEGAAILKPDHNSARSRKRRA